jgi:hypothetical protein
MRVKEIIKIKIDKKTIDVTHDGIDAYKNWKQESKDALQDWVEGTLNKGETEGWIPFANFEASLSFNINQIK